MNYAAILASGKGTRINSINYPKQFYKIKDKPIIVYTIEKLLNNKNVDCVYVAVSENYYEDTKKILKHYHLNNKVILIIGGLTRMDTIQNIVNDINKNNDVTDEDMILIQDAVRPFISDRIIKDSFDAAKKYGAVVASIPAVDTMLVSSDGHKVLNIPKRSNLYCGQSPDTFKLKYFLELWSNLTEEQKKEATGTSQVCTMNNKSIYLIEGDPYNFKITTDLDLFIAKKLIEEGVYENIN